jgi:hypothetical protein
MLNRGKRVLATAVVFGALAAADAGAAVAPREAADAGPVTIQSSAGEKVSLPGRIRKLVLRLYQELTPPIPAPKP